MQTKPALTSQTKDLPTSPVDSQQEDRGQPLKVKQDLPYGQMFKWGEVVSQLEWPSEWADWSLEQIDKTSKEKGIITLFGHGQYFFPDWQFQDRGLLPGLAQVIAELQHNDLDAVGQIIFMTTGDIRLSGRKPLDCLRKGGIDAVLHAAACYGQQIAS
jgi:hypothetical protein